MKNLLHLLCFLVSLSSLQAQDKIAFWKYQKDLWIDHLGNTELLEDYTLDILLNTEKLIAQGKLHPSGRDLRIYDPESQTFLCYWLENELYSTSCKLWFKVPRVWPNSRKKIVLCYGNPGAPQEDYAGCTFQFFDDFNGNHLDAERWQIQGNGQYKIHSSLIEFESLGQDIAIRTTQSFEMPLITEMKVTDVAGKYLALALIKSDRIPYIWEGYTLGLDAYRNHMELMLTQSELSPCQGYTLFPTGIKGKQAEAHAGIWSLSWITRNTIFGHWPGGDLLEQNAIWTTQQLDIVLGVLACDLGKLYEGKLAVDWVRVRKLAKNPPKLILGTENINPKIGVIKYPDQEIG